MIADILLDGQQIKTGMEDGWILRLAAAENLKLNYLCKN